MLSLTLILQFLMFEKVKGIIYKTENRILLVCKILILIFLNVFLFHTIE